MKCKRCGLERVDDVQSDICGTCADELRAEEDANIAQANAEAEAEARAKWEAEEAERIARDRY